MLKNLSIFVAQQQQQLVQCNEQLLGREHAQDQENSTMLNNDVGGSAANHSPAFLRRDKFCRGSP